MPAVTLNPTHDPRVTADEIRAYAAVIASHEGGRSDDLRYWREAEFQLYVSRLLDGEMAGSPSDSGPAC